jgi:hypothetical protein
VLAATEETRGRLAYSRILNLELSVVLGLQLKLKVEQQDLGVGDLLGLLLKTNVQS